MNLTTCIQNFPGNYSICEANDGICQVNPKNASAIECLCPEGHKGALYCDELIVPLQWVYGVSGTMYFLVFFTSIFLVVRRFEETKGKEYVLAHVNSVTPSHKEIPKWVLLAYRFVVFGITFGIHIHQIASDLAAGDATDWIYYTVWNFITVIIYFALGTSLSFVAVMFPDKYANSPFWTRISPLFLTVLHIELPNTILVDVVLWGVLFPSCGQPCPNLVNYTSLFEHMANAFFMWGDFLLSSNVFSRRNVQYQFLFASCYAIFHMSWTLSRDSGGHRPVYFFLDCSNPVQPLWVIGVMLLHLVFFYLVWGVSFYLLKRRFSSDAEATDETGNVTSAANPAFAPKSEFAKLPE